MIFRAGHRLLRNHIHDSAKAIEHHRARFAPAAG